MHIFKEKPLPYVFHIRLKATVGSYLQMNEMDLQKAEIGERTYI